MVFEVPWLLIKLKLAEKEYLSRIAMKRRSRHCVRKEGINNLRYSLPASDVQGSCHSRLQTPANGTMDQRSVLEHGSPCIFSRRIIIAAGILDGLWRVP